MSINIPNKQLLLTAVETIVRDYWSNPKLAKRVTYASTETNRDLVPGVPPNVAVHGIRSFLCVYANHDEDSEYAKTSTTEERRPLNDCVTDFVTTRFFEHSADRIRFIMLVTLVYERFFATIRAEIYKQDRRVVPADALILLLKGGVSLRMNLLEMVRNLSSAAEGDIALFLKDELKMSDFDFELVSNPMHIQPGDVARVSILSYLVVQQIRTYLVEHADVYFTFFRYSTAYKTSLLDELRTTLQAKVHQQTQASPYAGARVDAVAISPVACRGATIFSSLSSTFEPDLYTAAVGTNMDKRHPACRADFAIVPSASQTALRKPEDPIICFVSSRDMLRAYGIRQYAHPRSPLYATHNPYISFTAGTAQTLLEHIPSGVCNLHQQDNMTNDRIAFQLNRIRYTCVLYLSHADGRQTKEYITGELLDVSHAIDTDSKRSCAVCRTEKTWSYATSSIRFYPDVKFSILNPHEQYRDHYFMLFKQAEFPWMIPKYEKRVRRLVSILVMFLFSSRSRQQYTDWSVMSFDNRIETLRSTVTWLAHIRGGTLRPPLALRGVPLVYDLAVSIYKLCRQQQNGAPRQELDNLLDSIHTVFSFFLTIFVREKFYMTDLTLSHTPHDPGTLFDNVVST